MDGEDQPPDDLRYNGEGKKLFSMNREHVEDSFEGSNHNISKARSESCNTIVQSKKKAKPIDLSRPSHPQLRALNLRHESDVQSGPKSNLRKRAIRARWRQLYSQQQNGTAFHDIGGKTGQQRNWMTNDGGYSRS